MNDQQNTTPPVDHKAVNQWMAANRWKWVEGDAYNYGHWERWGKIIRQDLAAEMYRMAEGAMLDRQIDTAEKCLEFAGGQNIWIKQLIATYKGNIKKLQGLVQNVPTPTGHPCPYYNDDCPKCELYSRLPDSDVNVTNKNGYGNCTAPPLHPCRGNGDHRKG